MNFPSSYPFWIWLYFGAFGSISAIFFSMIAWSWFKSRSFAKEQLRSILTWNMFGYMFLFIGKGTTSAVLSMFFSVPGWACIFVGQRGLLKFIQHA